ncbi:MAG: GNAT family N-acetyltransferase [Gammaproteobacteria bacterium]
MPLTIRTQQPADLATICAINEAAFAEHGGTKAFDRFREERTDILSLVAVDEDELVGHVLFSPVSMATPTGPVMGMGLGQLAVTPARQNQGIGTLLGKAGINELRKTDCAYIIVIGHAKYYPRFGFEIGSTHGVKCQWEGIPDETFMVLFTDPARQTSLQGVASFEGM